jgi:hypothetical protein
MKAPPLQYQAQCARVETASYTAIGDTNLNLLARITRVKVRRLMFVVIHGNHNSEEAAYLRHLGILRSSAQTPHPTPTTKRSYCTDSFLSCAARSLSAARSARR